MPLHREYPHLSFQRKWELNNRCQFMLGECNALLKAISNTPILPSYYDELMRVALRKGAQSTTAIEGNTLTDEQIARLLEGKKLPESIEYQGIEVQNIIEAFNAILRETVYENQEQLITPDLLKRFHKMVGKNLGHHFAAVPGQFRNSDVVVGRYRCPDYRDVPELIDKYCAFLRNTFQYQQGNNNNFADTFIEAIVAHVYLEWIHPFGDGNGRTGRLVEFYVLSRGAYPDITLHILSNFYNATRPEYYRQLDEAGKTGDLSAFIEYALLGFRDGLYQTLETIQTNKLHITWQKYVYEKFDTVKSRQKDVFKRQRTFALEVPIDREFTLGSIPDLNIQLAKLYSNISVKTLERDVNDLVQLDILKEKDGKYFANIATLSKMVAKRKRVAE